jgi:hypothetical protein
MPKICSKVEGSVIETWLDNQSGNHIKFLVWKPYLISGLAIQWSMADNLISGPETE